MESDSVALASFDWSIWLTAGSIALLLCVSAFFSGSETALTAASRGKLHSMADKGSRGANRALNLTEDNERLIGSVLLGNNLVNIVATSLATTMISQLFAEGAVIIASALMTVLILIFAEVLPKTYAITNPETAAARVSPIIAVIVRLLSPVVRTVQMIVRSCLHLFGVSTDPDSAVLAAREEIAGAIALHHSEGAVEKDHRDRLLAALELEERNVEEVMMHRSNIEMIDAEAEPKEILARCLRSPYTRIPVYRDDPENIVGVIHAKDLLRAIEEARQNGAGIDSFDIMKVAMTPYFVPDRTSLDEQMRQFLRRRSHFALVVDEYGALQGLITLEDILEEIVGDIADEHDIEVEGIEREPDGSYIIDGAMTIRDLNRSLDWSLPDEEANTVAGLVIHEAQTIPTEGQVFHYHGFRFEIMARDANRLTQMRVRKMSS